MNVFSKVTVAGLLATVLFVSPNRAEPPKSAAPGKTVVVEEMTTEKLGQMLEGLGIDATPKKNADGVVTHYTATIAFHGGWKVSIAFSVSPDRSNVWMNAPMIRVQDPSAVPSAALLKLLRYNADTGASFFYFDSNNMLSLGSVMGAATLTPATLRDRIEEIQFVVIDSYQLWTQTALGQAPTPPKAIG